jgi:hypothetical protein
MTQLFLRLITIKPLINSSIKIINKSSRNLLHQELIRIRSLSVGFNNRKIIPLA